VSGVHSVPQALKKTWEGWVDPVKLMPLLEATFALPGRMAPGNQQCSPGVEAGTLHLQH
jgi:hypothetical protein